MPVIAAGAARTAVRACDGDLSGWHPVPLASLVGQAALERAGLAAGDLDEVIVGCADPVGANGADVARAVALAAGWPEHVGGHVIDRGETSGGAALQAAAAAISAGQAGAVMVIGLGLSSVVPPGAAALQRSYGRPWAGVAGRYTERGGLFPGPRLAEMAAARAGLTRGALQAAAEMSRRRRQAVTSPPVVPIVEVAARWRQASGKTGGPVRCDVIRDWGDPAVLPPLFGNGGLLTAATFSPPADAVCAVLLCDRLAIGGNGPGVCEIAGTGRAAGDPFDPTGAVALAAAQALSGTGARLDDMSGVWLSEPDTATTLLAAQALGIAAEQINPYGGAAATGHAGAAEELRLVSDGLARLAPGDQLLTISAGPTGSAAIVWRVHRA